ncbi:MAG: hypothetical protein AAB152_01210 [Candidatus Coatesbacteria bacterium]
MKRTVKGLAALALAVLGACGTGCSRQGPAAEARLAQALEAMQQGRLDDAARQLAAIKPTGGWLRSAAFTAPLALRLRAQIALRTGALEESLRLFREYDSRYGSLAPVAWVRAGLALVQKYHDWQGVPALLYLRGLEVEEDNPALALRTWRGLLRDYPRATIAPAAQLKLGLLQERLENPTWALADLTAVSDLPADAVDQDGNPVAPRALLAIGEIHRDLRQDPPSARAAFDAVIAKYGKTTFTSADGLVKGSPAALAKLELARMAPDGGPGLLEAVAGWTGPTGFVTADRVGDVRMEARFRLAELALKRRSLDAAKTRVVEIVIRAPDVPAGPPSGPRPWYGYQALDWLGDQLGRRSPETALAGLAEVEKEARHREIWAYAAFQHVRLLARLNRQQEARAVLAELERRFPNLECDADGTGLTLVPAREARKVLGG